MSRRIHYFGAPKNNKVFEKYVRFITECGVYIEREDIDYITNNKKRVTCKNCLYLLQNRHRSR